MDGQSLAHVEGVETVEPEVVPTDPQVSLPLAGPPSVSPG